MFNHHRGLWGYTGAAPDGLPLTIQSTGMGGPSAAIVLTELISLGVTRAIRVGTCGALVPGLGLGELLIASEALCADGTSRALGASDVAGADRTSAPACARPRRGRARGRVLTVDLFYDDREIGQPARRSAMALAVEMEAATLFAVGARPASPWPAC